LDYYIYEIKFRKNMANHLDLAGLTAYDRKIKAWFKSGVVDITNDAINALFVVTPEGPADNEIWYTTKTKTMCNFEDMWNHPNEVISHIYDDKGILTFKDDVKSIEGVSGAYYDNDVYCSYFHGCFGGNIETRGEVITKNIPTEITAIWIPSTVTAIRPDAFVNCPYLTNIFFAGTKEQLNAILDNYEYGFSMNGTAWIDHQVKVVHCIDGDVEI
jgi:hypothetical protein